MVIDPSFWKNKNVFLTGHTGFKGSWLSLWLNHLGAKVTGYALEPPTDPSLFYVAKVTDSLYENVYGDIGNIEQLADSMRAAQPEVVIHMAAQSLVRESYVDPVNTYNTNVMGTVHILEVARKTNSVKTILNITSDKCYENKEQPTGYTEESQLGGYDPYSSSKGCSELVSSAYRNSFLQDCGIALGTARSGNVIGGGDWAKDRIVPDAIKAFCDNKSLMVRNPKATRPWQHVLEPLAGYLLLCQELTKNPKQFASSWNFGPNETDLRSVSFVVDILAELWKNDASWYCDKSTHPHEAQSLTLDCHKANVLLNWNPIWCISRTLQETTDWYKEWNSGNSMYDFSMYQIKKYQQECLNQ